MIDHSSDSSSKNKTFIDRCLMGMYINASKQLEVEIECWERIKEMSSLNEYLGMTDEEYEEYKSTPVDKKAMCFKSILLNRMISNK